MVVMVTINFMAVVEMMSLTGIRQLEADQTHFTAELVTICTS